MANPQLENGHTSISNELLEAMIKTPLSDYEQRVFLAVIRKTYGWKKKMDWISNLQIVEMTDMKAPHVSRTLKKLRKKNMIIKEGKQFGINKDYDTWLGKLPEQVTKVKSTETGKLPKQATTDKGSKDKKLPKQVTEVTHTGNNKLPKQVTPSTKERKTTIQNKYIYTLVFNHWNNKNIIVHQQVTKNMKKEIGKALRQYGKEKVLKAINRYAIVVNDTDYFFNHSWSLEQFLKQKNAMLEFFEQGTKWIAYSKDKENNKKNKGDDYESPVRNV